MSSNKINKALTDIPETKWISLEEYEQLYVDLKNAHQETARLYQKLSSARKALDDGTRNLRAIEREKNLLEMQVNTVRRLLFNDKQINLDEEVRKKLEFLDAESKFDSLSIKDKHSKCSSMTTNTTGSILSDLNLLSKSEESDLDTFRKAQWQRLRKEHKVNNEHVANKQCSTLEKVAEFNSSSKTIPAIVKSDKKNIEPKLLLNANHNIVSKIVITPITCIGCNKRIRFAKIVLKCKTCSIICHTKCRTRFFSFLCIDEKSSKM
ncbi:rac GTPase-activating protein 1-like isoform X2 [Pseudomyrmex gracilis]|uniref:rac GTPase-activating protein 1-like isoform X2 n=1 Tax=Pseudomyrmex gracilis TaxID=219809 RepID=UPI000994D9CB|nr:rac GTPase-activating protein 1-like isoform X2 [Pseudomyrmex gracilis]